MAQSPMGTLKKRIERPTDIQDPNVVKVVTDAQGNALYFSRSPIPYARDGEQPAYSSTSGYTSTAATSARLSGSAGGPLERAERLEQLRALENGHKIRVVETEYESLGVDTPEDWRQVAELFEKTMVNR